MVYLAFAKVVHGAVKHLDALLFAQLYKRDMCSSLV
uniref:Uncharacterized protein n=1 Tax=Arundo donax TaxID=35708 RepID=A0A0A9FU60_ARUDO